MASTHTSRTLLASTSVAAAASQNTAELNLTTAYGALVNARVTNGATGPTVACNVTVYTGDASGKKYRFYTFMAGTDASGVYDFAIEIPEKAMFVNITFGGHTGQAVTCECYAQELTTV